MNNALILVAFVVYSFYIALSTTLYWSDLLPLVFLAFTIQTIPIKKLLFLNVFVCLTSLSVMFVDPKLALLILLRANIIFIVVLLLFNKKEYFFLLYGLNTLKISNKFVLVVFFFIKSTQYLLDELKKINTSLKARGYEPKTNLFTYKTYANMVAILILKTIKQSHSIQKTIVIRNFHGQMYPIVSDKLEPIYLIFAISVGVSCIFQFGKLL